PLVHGAARKRPGALPCPGAGGGLAPARRGAYGGLAGERGPHHAPAWWWARAVRQSGDAAGAAGAPARAGAGDLPAPPSGGRQRGEAPDLRVLPLRACRGESAVPPAPAAPPHPW